MKTFHIFSVHLTCESRLAHNLGFPGGRRFDVQGNVGGRFDYRAQAGNWMGQGRGLQGQFGGQGLPHNSFLFSNAYGAAQSNLSGSGYRSWGARQRGQPGRGRNDSPLQAFNNQYRRGGGGALGGFDGPGNQYNHQQNFGGNALQGGNNMFGNQQMPNGQNDGGNPYADEFVALNEMQRGQVYAVRRMDMYPDAQRTVAELDGDPPANADRAAVAARFHIVMRRSMRPRLILASQTRLHEHMTASNNTLDGYPLRDGNVIYRIHQRGVLTIEPFTNEGMQRRVTLPAGQPAAPINIPEVEANHKALAKAVVDFNAVPANRAQIELPARVEGDETYRLNFTPRPGQNAEAVTKIVQDCNFPLPAAFEAAPAPGHWTQLTIVQVRRVMLALRPA